MDSIDWASLEAETFPEIEPGTLVVYEGTIEAARGEVYRVAAQVADDRFTLASVVNPWERLNADRSDISVHLPGQADR